MLFVARELSEIRQAPDVGWSCLYAPILRRLGLPAAAVDIALGKLPVPGAEPPLRAAAFPPALVPLWSTGAGTIVGLWKHWCVPGRGLSFCEFYGVTAFGRRDLVVEIARTFEQLMYVVLLRAIVQADGVTSEVEALARAAGVSDLADVDERSLKTGDDPVGLSDHPAFSWRPGELPGSGAARDVPDLGSTCMFELHGGFREMTPDYSRRRAVSELPQAPPWPLPPPSPQESCAPAIQKGDLRAAWLCLNAPGWTVSRARQSLHALAVRSDAPELLLLAEAWGRANSVALTSDY